MKTVDIKGKSYVMVNERLKAFRAEHKGYGLLTEIIELTADSCTMQAKIIDEKGQVIAMGTAREEREDKSSMVNRTSFVENCETSAWGRALGNFGIGIDESIASADEVARAIEKQNSYESVKTEMTLEEARKLTTKSGTPFDKLSDDYLIKILDSKANDRSKAAARIILSDRNSDDLRPIDEVDLPF